MFVILFVCVCAIGQDLESRGLETSSQSVCCLDGRCKKKNLFYLDLINRLIPRDKNSVLAGYEHQSVTVQYAIYWPNMTGESQQFLQTSLDIELTRYLG